MNYIEFLSNNILNNVTDSQADIIYLKLSRECVSNKIKFEVETEPNELLPYLCLMLLENNLIGPKSANGSKILIDILENQCLSELATKLKIYDQENEFGKLTLKENSNDSGIMSNSSSTNEPLSSLFKNNLQSSKNALEDTISRCSSTLSLFSNESESKISNETDETQEFREVFNVKVLDEMVDLHFKPYDFQVNLALNSCKNVNNLIVVRTGSGKTLVAALITKFWYIKRKKDKTLKTFKCVFLVPTRNLVYQQAASFRRAFSKDFIQEIDEKSNEFKIKEKFQLDEKHVFFMTPQKLVNCLQSCVLNITDISILIFDECHHTNLLHPYNVIMEYYLREKMLNLPLPLIVGLSASLGTGPNDSAFKHIFTLCSNMSCKIISYVKSEGDKQNLNENIPSPLGDIVHHVALSENLKKLLSKTNMVVRELMSLAKIDQQGCEVGSKPFENFLHMLKINSEKSEDQTRINACKYLIELNLFYLGVQDFPIKYSLRKLRNFLAKTNTATFSKYELEFRKHLQSLITYIEKNIERFEINTKLEKMAEVILGHHRNESKGLCLVTTRHHVKAVEEFLNDHIKLKSNNIKPICLLGANNSSTDGILMSMNQQKNAIKKFRDGQSNLLVATDIAQEGLDIPECNYVIRYEFVSNEIGTVQSRGRARAEKGQTFLITVKDSENDKREQENRLKEILMEKALKEYSQMSQRDFEKEFNKCMEKLETNPKLFINHSNSNREIMERSFGYKPENVNVKCRNCSETIFNGGELKFRDPNYVCDYKSLHGRVKVNAEKFYCLTSTCNKELGKLMNLKNSMPLFIVDIKGVKFEIPNLGVQVLSKWSKVSEYFSIKPI